MADISNSANEIFDAVITTTVDLSNQGQYNNKSTDPVILSIDQFSNTMTAAKAVLPGVTPISFDVSAEATIFLKTSWIRSVFQFQGDQDAVGEDSTGSMTFFVQKSAWDWDASGTTARILNPAHAMVHLTAADISYGQVSTGDQHLPVGKIPLAGVLESDIPSTKFMVKHDFARHLAKQIFNVPITDAFYNLDELLASIEIGGLAAWNSIRTLLDAAYNTSSGLGEDNDTTANIVFQLFQQMRVANPHRFFADGSDSTIMDSSDIVQPLPFVDGDVIVFTFTVNPASGQATVLKDSTGNTALSDATIHSRKYLIKLCIVDNIVGEQDNKTPDDTYKTNSADSSSLGTLTELADLDACSTSPAANKAPPAEYQLSRMYMG